MLLIPSSKGEYSELEKRVYERLNSLLKDYRSFSVELLNPLLGDRYGFQQYIPDILIKKEGKIVSIIEVKSESQFLLNSNYRIWENRYAERLPEQFKDCLFAITDGNRMLFKYPILIITDYTIFVKILTKKTRLNYFTTNIGSYKNQIKSYIETHIDNKSDLKEWVDTLTPDSFEENDISVRFSSDELENCFFLYLLGKVTDDKICRYTSLNSLFTLLKSVKQNMCSIVCMNDKGELNYVNKKVSFNCDTIPDDPNNCYIMSLLPISHENELTFWRLYGDNAEGVCLTYSINKNLKNGEHKGFYLAHVSYEDENGNHPELAFINDLAVSGFNNNKVFTFRNWHIWKHFFKSHHYSIEDEVRLLYVPSNNDKTKFDWIKNDDNKIVSKMLLFDLKSNHAGVTFPLNLFKVIIGPKIGDGDVIEQYGYMAKSTIKSVGDVISSDLMDTYR